MASRIEALMDNDFPSLKSFLEETPPDNWRRTLNNYGMTPLQQAVHDQNKGAFDLLLPYHDSKDLEVCDTNGRTVLMVALKLRSTHYFVTELIKKDILLDQIYDDGSYLHVAIAECLPVTAIRLLLERGIKVNLQDKLGNTPLHQLFLSERSISGELVTMLLSYGADPSVENTEGFTPFDFAFRRRAPVDICEVMFMYAFDELTTFKLHMQVVVLMATKTPSILNRLVDYSIEIVPFYVSKTSFYFFLVHSIDVLLFLLNCEPDFLKFLLRDNSSAISGTLTCLTQTYMKNYVNRSLYSLLLCEKSLINLSLLLDSEKKDVAVEFLQAFENFNLFETVIREHNRKVSGKILAFFLSYGLVFTWEEYQLVYGRYGYCDLFELLIHIGASGFSDSYFCHKNAMAALICDVDLNYEHIFQPHFWYTDGEDLLGYFANPRVSQLLLECPSVCRNPAATEARIRKHPKVPLLQELARDAFRKHFIETFNIASAKQFGCLLNGLSISRVCKKIITYETKLYPD